MVTVMKDANLALAFLLELCALAALGYWGFHAARGSLMAVVLGLGAPLLAAVVWGMFVAPRATIPVTAPVHLALELAVFGAAVAGLAVAGRLPLAWVLGIVFVANRILIGVWGQ